MISDNPVLVDFNQAYTNSFHLHSQLYFIISVSIRYGGCISKYYSNQFTCKKLFSDDSNFSPSTLLNLITDSDDFVESFAEDFRQNATKYLPQLFSKGMGIVDFVQGIFSTCEMIGLNMKAMRKLKQPITDYLTALLTLPITGNGAAQYTTELKKQKDHLIKAVGNVDTNQNVPPDKVYSFFRGIFPMPGSNVDDAIKRSEYRLVIENVPRLVRSMFQDNNLALKWFDGGLNAISKVNARNLTQSAIDMTNEITTSVTMPTYGKKIIRYAIRSFLECSSAIPPITFPPSFASCFTALLEYDEPDNYTIALTNKVTTLIKTIFSSSSSSSSQRAPTKVVEMMSNSLQTLFRTLAPIPKSEMNAAYLILIDGFDSIDYTNIDRSKRLEKTKMSEFLLNILQSTKPNLAASYEAIIINLSKTFYNAMTSQYTAKLDTFFTTLITGFKQFPTVNAGAILKNLFENFEQEVPLGLRPLVNHLQPVIDSIFMRRTPRRGNKITAALKNLTTAYQTAFPASKFPPIASRYVKFLERQLLSLSDLIRGYDYSSCQIDQPDYRDCIEGLSMKQTFVLLKEAKLVNSIEIDLFFAILETTGFTSDSYIKRALANNQTALAAYARLMKSLDHDDVKELLNDYEMWLRNVFHASDNYIFDNFILAINYTTDKIINKLTKVMKDLRYVHAPE